MLAWRIGICIRFKGLPEDGENALTASLSYSPGTPELKARAREVNQTVEGTCPACEAN